MPLEHGPVGSAEFKHNIATEIKAGKPAAQAEAIAYRTAGERVDAILSACDRFYTRFDARMSRRDAVFQEVLHPRDKYGKFSLPDDVDGLIDRIDSMRKRNRVEDTS